uniref:Uncharacterized protein n=1 Tax=Pithovirus LCPAC101 TaxID=2506586 RepID=A0A481Z2K0_9VIRU|nr:MAG: hypothetical protein LCPAC101_02450 [Pithovirus LCPAC101]
MEIGNMATDEDIIIPGKRAIITLNNFMSVEFITEKVKEMGPDTTLLFVDGDQDTAKWLLFKMPYIKNLEMIIFVRGNTFLNYRVSPEMREHTIGIKSLHTGKNTADNILLYSLARLSIIANKHINFAISTKDKGFNTADMELFMRMDNRTLTVLNSVKNIKNYLHVEKFKLLNLGVDTSRIKIKANKQEKIISRTTDSNVDNLIVENILEIGKCYQMFMLKKRGIQLKGKHFQIMDYRPYLHCAVTYICIHKNNTQWMGKLNGNNILIPQTAVVKLL